MMIFITAHRTHHDHQVERGAWIILTPAAICPPYKVQVLQVQLAVLGLSKGGQFEL